MLHYHFLKNMHNSVFIKLAVELKHLKYLRYIQNLKMYESQNLNNLYQVS